MAEYIDIAAARLTLTGLEIVLGIDNIVFIAILSGRLPEEKRMLARRIGLLAAMGMRVLLLLAIGWVVGLDRNVLFTLFEHEFSWRDVILFGGGVFLLAKATHEIHNKLEGSREETAKTHAGATLGSVIAQIALMDIIFSLDSVITAVGMAEHLWVMITAVVIAILVMMVFARPVSDFVEQHPTVKMLALSFLLLIGFVLVMEGFEQHVPKGYIYSAIIFSLFVEMLNLRMKKVAARRVELHGTRLPEE